MANAIYNACGVRIREFRMTLDKVFAGLDKVLAGMDGAKVG